jgi:hypothetical protein
MSLAHREATAGRWQKMSLCEQLANIGAEVDRAISWKNKDNKKYSQNAFERALELLDLTLSDCREYPKLKELARVRELLADYFFFDNSYRSTDQSWQKYFYHFNYAARH